MIGTELTLIDLVEGHAAVMPSQTALRAHPSGDRRSWRDLAARTRVLGADFARHGVAEGDVVACLSRNRIWVYEVILAAMRTGAIPSPLSPLLTPDMLARLLRDSGAKLLLADPPLMPLALASAKAAGGDIAVLEGPATDAVGDVEAGDVEVRGGAAHKARADRACNLIYSSGATGTPKGIVHTHRARLALATALGLGFRLTGSSVTALVTPPFTNGTWMTWLPTLLVGGTSLVLEAPGVDDFEAAAALYGATHAFMVPTQFQALLKACDPSRFSAMRAFITAGAPMPDGLKARFTETYGPRLFELWGLTEGLGVVISPEEMAERPHSVGRPAGGCTLRVINSAGEDVTGREVGEIVGRSTSMMEGYWNRPDLDANATWTDNNGVRHLRSGDLGEIDGDGYLRIRGREKDMIISGGLNVYPVDIEAVLRRQSGVIDAAVVGQTHEKWGETPVAFVHVDPSAGVAAGALLDSVNAELAKHQRLSAVHLQAEDLPRNALGKVLKAELAARLGSAPVQA